MIKRKKYADGTKGIKGKKGPGGDVENPTPSVTPPVEDNSLDSLGDNPVESLPQGSLSPSKPGGLAKGGSAYVASLQAKYKAMGADIAVDGAWGPQTQKAFEKYQASQSKSTPAIPKVKLPKGDKEFVSGPTPTGNLGKSYRELASFYDKPTPKAPPKNSPPAKPSLEFDKAQDPGTYLEDAYQGITYPEATSPKGEVSKVGNGYQFYPNGRAKAPNGRMETYSRLPKRGTPSMPMDPETVAARKALKAKLVQASERKW